MDGIPTNLISYFVLFVCYTNISFTPKVFTDTETFTYITNSLYFPSPIQNKQNTSLIKYTNLRTCIQSSHYERFRFRPEVARGAFVSSARGALPPSGSAVQPPRPPLGAHLHRLISMRKVRFVIYAGHYHVSVLPSWQIKLSRSGQS